MAALLERWTCNSDSPRRVHFPPDRFLNLTLGSPKFKSSAMLVK